MSPSYAARGIRFAPSPTGRFHLGNLRTAWISWSWAHAWREPWVVRFEDIDRPRVLPGAREVQLTDLAALGMVPDELHTQSERGSRHWEVFQRAVSEGQVYPCTCSRKEVQEALQGMASAPHAEPPVYIGKCRPKAGQIADLSRLQASHPTIAWRFLAEDESGAQDTIIARTENTRRNDPSGFAPAYHWACAIDDWDGNYKLLVRAWDLESAAAHQRRIQAWLRASEGGGRAHAALPAIYHTALVTTDAGGRLEKRTRGVTWPELREHGMSAERLVELFRKSWEQDATELTRAFREGSIGGERRRTITLSQLGCGV